ncbi:HAD superfamily hydrolase-like protein [Tricharina praecox]|uniref:HAD superfamily hydrolase-like protein n=1 Tax=Tricharina praecox TaxID=43433 RepID=UPI00221FFCDB|nr:HAD superfamily hydrolase-like protein [Tricharina praecox]KAI5853705.1 HAD superfamily hydrolase-like protein [Tricharina praecox]
MNEFAVCPTAGRDRRVSSVSSMVATAAKLDSGPTVVVPPASYMASTIPETMAIARAHTDHTIMDDEISSDDESSTPISTVVPTYAFAFDIDGVLLAGGEVIPGAKEAMRVLNGENPDGIKVPYIFVTNGGGKTEQERCLDLSKQLGVSVSPGQFICGHTPMREMAEKYGTVLVVGGEGEKCRNVAEGYGFNDVVTPGDIMKWKSAVTPFRNLTDDEHKNSRDRDFSQVEIEAIFVFADSRFWGDDTQIILDLLMSKNGRMGTLSDTFDEGPPIYFSHNDVVWATNFGLNRLGMGALRVFIEALYKERTGKTLKSATSFGKPQVGTFQYATRVLEQWREDVFGEEGPPKTVYFVGDTPESDIRGTNEFHKHVDEEWYSILVKTGVYQSGTEPRHKPRVIVDNVLDAVKHGMERSRKAALKEMEELNNGVAVQK